ncbi:MAG: metalloregulator ArsR/SmtB family transcription factor [Candidatus Lokiarchaeota archaeon]|nr:metalloregulator ArsR/SmtB family transcription factor [Candidatus Lokiarchaeota archaeon]
MLCSCKGCDETNSYFEELQKIKLELDNSDNFNQLSLFATTLASKERLIILHLLKNRDRCVCELEAVLDKSQSTISHHIRKLVSSGLIVGYKNGNFTYYHLIKENFNFQLEILTDSFKRSH